MKKNIVYVLFGFLLSGPISFKAFDYNLNDNFYGRGDYVIVLASSQLETYLTNPNASLGGDFVKFKNTQGFNVHVVSLDQEGFSSAEELKNYLIEYDEQSNGMLEYVLLVGDVNGQYTIPTFTINSYNEQEIDVTDYPYTFTDNPYEPKFFIGRWPIRTIPEFLNIKSRSVQYITNENLLLSGDDLEFYNNAMLVAGNYKTADGLEVSPNEWPVTPVWTSLWLQEELNGFGYAQVDTAFFHQYNYQTATYNPLIEDKWNQGVGVINYRGWGDANGWHKPYFHREEVLSLDNQWRLPVVMSFVCNTGDFGNDYSGTGLDKCFGEVLITAGSINSPKGAAAMVGPSDLDTDTRFNNVMCGVMWDGLLEGLTPELGPALHLGKQSLIDEFSGLSVEGTIIDVFYHHVYSVIGDPSLPVTLKKPGNIISDLDSSDDGNADENLLSSHIVTYVYDSFGNPIEDLVGVLFKNGEPFNDSENSIYRGVSDSNGLLIIDFELNEESDLQLYLNKAQFLQKSINISYDSDNGNSLDEMISASLDIDIYGDLYAVPGEWFDFNVEITNSNEFSLNNVDLSIMMDDSNTLIEGFEIGANSAVNLMGYTVLVSEDYNVGDKLIFSTSFDSSNYNLTSDNVEVVVSDNESLYLENFPSPRCEYGYRAIDSNDTDFDGYPVYNWIELNEIENAQNLLLQDDTLTSVALPFDFKFYGIEYQAGSPLTVCSNGWISLEETFIDYFWNFSIPSPMGPSSMIAPFMDDLDDNEGTEPFDVYYYYDMQNNRLIIEWDNVSNGEDDQNCPNCIKESFQVILLDPDYYTTSSGDGEIIFQYKEIYDIDSNGNYSTIGIESPDQDIGVEYLFSNHKGLGSSWASAPNTLITGLAIKFTTNVNDMPCVMMDLNLDGSVNIVDVIGVVNIIIGLSNPTETQLCSADINADGTVNIVDVIAIVNTIISL
tara:strand:- start:866 stop:3697 length:2832 start_codon:yes stop_codon:yes gene_type:complete